jgi:hypothetical protein
VAGQVNVCGATPKGVGVWRVLEVTGPRFPRLLQRGLIYELARTRMARGSTRWIRRWREEERSQEMYSSAGALHAGNIHVSLARPSAC